MKIIKDNFLVVNQYHYDISWIEKYTDNYVVYDKGGTEIESDKTIRLPNIGSNIHTWFYHIIQNYDNLPDVIIFAKGNISPRHCREEKLLKLINNSEFTPLESYEDVDTSEGSAMRLTDEGGYMEINNSWYVPHHVSRYFQSYSYFLKTIFVNPEIPQWVRFAPGANYIVPKENILKHEKRFYEKLNSFVSYEASPLECAGRDKIPAECHIIERALYTIWTSDYQVNPNLYR